jgi:hypothetical protein
MNKLKRGNKLKNLIFCVVLYLTIGVTSQSYAKTACQCDGANLVIETGAYIEMSAGPKFPNITFKKHFDKVKSCKIKKDKKGTYTLSVYFKGHLLMHNNACKVIKGITINGQNVKPAKNCRVETEIEGPRKDIFYLLIKPIEIK